MYYDSDRLSLFNQRNILHTLDLVNPACNILTSPKCHIGDMTTTAYMVGGSLRMDGSKVKGVDKKTNLAAYFPQSVAVIRGTEFREKQSFKN